MALDRRDGTILGILFRYFRSPPMTGTGAQGSPGWQVGLPLGIVRLLSPS